MCNKNKLYKVVVLDVVVSKEIVIWNNICHLILKNLKKFYNKIKNCKVKLILLNNRLKIQVINHQLTQLKML